jgi:hypothetical protein
MSGLAVEREYKQLLEEQIRHATGMRLEQLQKQGEGERKFLVEILWPVRKSFLGDYFGERDSHVNWGQSLYRRL